MINKLYHKAWGFKHIGAGKRQAGRQHLLLSEKESELRDKYTKIEENHVPGSVIN
jgi:hypothetical protein